MLLSIRVIPRASKNEVVGAMTDGTLKVRLAAPPVDGKANEALIEVLSDHLRVSKNKIILKRGLTRRNKVVEILK